jgi:hypothetical protein
MSQQPQQPRHPARPLILAPFALIAFLVLTPSLATAQPPRVSSSPATATSTAHSETTFPLLANLRSLFSALWKNGSGLEPNGRPGPVTTAGDTGSILEPDGRH